MSRDDYRTVILKPLAEETSQVFSSPLIDSAGDPILPLDVSAMTMTLYDESTGAIINSRNGTNILNQNGGTVTAGAWKLELLPADMAILSDTRKWEVHILLIEWTMTGGRKGKAEITMTVVNLAKVS